MSRRSHKHRSHRRRRHSRRHRHGISALFRDFSYQRRRGWGYNLYRNTRDGKIGGVAAGIADYWEIEHWVSRLLWIVLFLFTGTLAFWLYVGAWIVLAPRSAAHAAHAAPGEAVEDAEYEEMEIDTEYDEIRHQHRPRKVFRYGESTSVRLQRARERLDASLRRVEDMESYVTSRRYNLNKEFSRL
ncbi:MAG: envelope stress response membrane protein PspC [Halioglobus sp.]